MIRSLMISIILLLGCSVLYATPIDPVLLNTTGNVDVSGGVYTLDGNSHAVESLYIENYYLDQSVSSIQFDFLFHWDEDGMDWGSNFVALRLFADGQWQDLWQTTTPYDLWVGFEPDKGDSQGRYQIDLSAFQNSVIALGWSFVADGPELSYAQVSNIHFIPEPSLWVITFLAMITVLVWRRR